MAMTVLGISKTVSNGEIKTTLFVSYNFESYHTNPEAGRSCQGKKTASIYVGAYDCSKIFVNSEIEIYYDKMVTTAKGSFQQVKKIEILK